MKEWMVHSLRLKKKKKEIRKLEVEFFLDSQTFRIFETFAP